MKWKRDSEGVYRSKCGQYAIEKYDGLLRGSRAWWVVSGATAGQKPTLRAAKRMAELHDATQAKR